MRFTDVQLWLAGWLALTSAVTFALFGYDKWQAARRGPRVSEFALCLASAVGGWPGGLAGILLLRHKSAKGAFQLKFAVASIVWAGALWLLWRSGGLRR